jgi:cytoplasmic FMR1 interacting protein
LGRSVDINRLLAQRLSLALQRSIEFALTRFESGDLSTVLVGIGMHNFVSW